ncbi:TetR/AcrR family transcriptional regulator [Terrabacter sp. NPDC080008]|uniref:TetR/AcrR family transcriptional regulator n=1 Tax=Terrabacter sp. NPDC080008 TaxID=3155176 RepID=UPI00344EF84F
MVPARGRPRDAEADDRIARAAVDLLRDEGPAAVHIDAVASRAKVARTTVYRRYRNRAALLAATLGQLAEAPLPSPDLPLQDKLRWVLEQALELVEVELGRGAIAAVLADADPDFTAAFREHLVRQLTALQERIDADITAGRIRAETDAEAVAGLAFGAYLGELLRHGRARPGWSDGVIEVLLNGTSPGRGRP